jgi:hypothetical protein
LWQQRSTMIEIMRPLFCDYRAAKLNQYRPAFCFDDDGRPTSHVRTSKIS